MSERGRQHNSGEWPTRERLIGWGLVPCDADGCRILVAPGVGRCMRHRARDHRSYRRRS